MLLVIIKNSIPSEGTTGPKAKIDVWDENLFSRLANGEAHLPPYSLYSERILVVPPSYELIIVFPSDLGFKHLFISVSVTF